MGSYPCCCPRGGSSTGSSVPTSTSTRSLETLPGCNSCQGGLISRYYLVELFDIAPGCEACHNLNAAYIVEISLVSETVCYGSLFIDGACADDFENGCYREMQLHFGTVDEVLGVPVWLTIGHRSGESGPGECNNVTTIQWQAYLSAPGEPVDCLGLNAEILPFHSQLGSVAYCEGSDSYAQITAINNP